MAPNLIGSLGTAGLAAGLAGSLAGLAWAITIGAIMILRIKMKTVKIINLLISLLLSV
jgi:hypothetical protein